jgi:hypothetical protein
MTVVQLAHVALFLVEFRFFLFQFSGFARSELTALNAVRNAILLVLFPLVDGGQRGLGTCIAGLGHRRQHQSRNRPTKKNGF